MRIILNNSSMVPIYEQLISQIKKEILDGELTENSPLPSVRRLSSDLKISALTVKKAYDRLDADGFVKTVHGKGTFVSHVNTAMEAEVRKKAVEDEFVQVIEKAKRNGFTVKEIRELIDILLEV